MSTIESCPFCSPSAERVFYDGSLVVGLWDSYPVSPGHALLVPKRHVETWFDASTLERMALVEAIDVAKAEIERTRRPDGYNIGANVGTAAGQTVFHLHVHLIPRYLGDTPNPRGGVRGVIPGQADYLPVVHDAGPAYRTSEDRLLVTGGVDPLLPHLKRHLATARKVDIAVAFVMPSGIELIWDHLKDALDSGGHVRMLTGDYLDATDPDALLRLLDLEAGPSGTLERRVFQSVGDGNGLATAFHPKAYLFQDSSDRGIAFIGSSNLSRSALLEGVEWNYRILSTAPDGGFHEVQRAFDRLFTDRRTTELTADWIEAYRSRRKAAVASSAADVPKVVEPEVIDVPEPHLVQQKALAAIAAARQEGKRAGLVVLATGLGKTWLSAFDSVQFERVLFIAHREEILGQAMRTYRRIRPHDHLGHYTGTEKQPHARVIFASVQTLSRREHLERFRPEHFDYIVMDEFHHASAATYRKLLQHFRPKFLLGLTATPERSDGADLLDLCDGNLLYRCDLAEGVRQELLCPFHYFGVPDLVDYRNIPWRSTRFDEEALTREVATIARAENALEQLDSRGGKRVLAFCVSQRHADFMAEFFSARGKKAAAVHSGPHSAPRTESLEALAAGDLDIVCAVDMLNEGVDLPDLDTVLMLRPTESRILWMQQFGRGLRKSAAGKTLKVIDYIGNHRVFLLKPQTLFGLPAHDSEIQHLLERLQRGQQELPPGCEVTYDLQAVDILKGLLRVGRGESDLLRTYVRDFLDRHGVRPTAQETYRDGYNPRSVRQRHGSWHEFLRDVDALEPAERSAWDAGSDFLRLLESTPMSKSYKMVVLLVLLNEDSFPGSIPIAGLMSAVSDLGRQKPEIAADFGEAWSDDSRLRRSLEDNPIAAWTGGAGTDGAPAFQYADGVFSSTVTIDRADRQKFQEMTRELAEWRLAEYFDRPQATSESTWRIKVNHSNGNPILMPLNRATRPGLPEGWTPLEIDGVTYQANFVSNAVNVLRKGESERNELAGVMRGWFGHDAGAPGTRHEVELAKTENGWSLRPLGVGSQVAVLWKAYSREQIPVLFGLPFVGAVWNQGFVRRGDKTFLLVTLDKSTAAPEHKYDDQFLSPTTFQWQSQNKTGQSDKDGKSIAEHKQMNIAVHLFVRQRSKTRNGKACPFYYCGQVDFLDWERDRPITVRWKLQNPVPENFSDELRVPAGNSERA